MEFLIIYHDLSDQVERTSWESYKTKPLIKLVFYFWKEYSLSSKLLSIQTLSNSQLLEYPNISLSSLPKDILKKFTNQSRLVFQIIYFLIPFKIQMKQDRHPPSNKRIQINTNPYNFSNSSDNKQHHRQQYSQLIEDSPNSSQEHSERSEDDIGSLQNKDCYVKCIQNIGILCLPFTILTPCLFCNICPCKPLPILIQPSYGISLLNEWGQFRQILQPGLHFLNPISQTTIYISYQTQLCGFQQTAMTKDNAQTTLQIIIFYRIIDAFKLQFKLGKQKLQICLIDMSMSILRNLVGQYNLQQVIENRAIISQQLAYGLNQSLQKYGLYVQSSSIKELLVSDNIRREIQTVAIATKNLQATLIQNNANVFCSELIKEMSNIINTKSALQIRYLKMVQQILSQGSEHTIILNTSMFNKQQKLSSLI